MLAGEYDERVLSDKAKRVWSEAGDQAIEPTETKRPETPKDVLKQEIEGQTTCDEERALREHLLDKYGTYAYENWFQGCGYDDTSGKLTHGNSFYRYEIERKYGVKVDV